MTSSSQTRSLGAAASALIAATFDDSDYSIEADCNGLIGGAQARQYDLVAQKFGYRDRHVLIAAIAQVTTSRWVYMNLNIC